MRETTERPYQLFKDLSPAVESALRASIKRFGVLVPVAKDQHGNVLDGHQRLRVAGELGVDVPTTVIEVASADEAREIARTLNEDRRAMPKAERLEVVKALREEGHTTRAIAGAVGVDHSTVIRDLAGGASAPPARVTGLDGKSYPARKTGVLRTQSATRERERRISELAAEGHTAAQIGPLVGMTKESVKDAAKRAGIDLIADQVMGRGRYVDLERVVGKTVANLEAEALSLGSLPADLPFTHEQASEWATSISESLRTFRRLLRQLEGIS